MFSLDCNNNNNDDDDDDSGIDSGGSGDNDNDSGSGIDSGSSSDSSSSNGDYDKSNNNNNDGDINDDDTLRTDEAWESFSRDFNFSLRLSSSGSTSMRRLCNPCIISLFDFNPISFSSRSSCNDAI